VLLILLVRTVTSSSNFFNTAVSFGWSDAILTRDAANIIAQRNGTNGQEFRVYGTSANSNADNEFLSLKFANSRFEIGALRNGTGNARNIAFITGNGSGSLRWFIDFTGAFTSGGANSILQSAAWALTTTSTDGYVLANTTAALVGTQVQISPRSRLSGTGWDLDDAVSRNVSFFTEVLPVAGNTVTGTWKLGFINPISSAISYPLIVTNSGQVTADRFIASSIIDTGTITFNGAARAELSASADGLFAIKDSTHAFGIQLNTGTAAPTVGTCGTGTIDANSRNTVGGFTATGATACTVTFGAPNWTNTPTCVVTMRNVPVTTPYISAISTTAFTVSGLTANDSVAFHCLGRI
jgi:hypothetical protein